MRWRSILILVAAWPGLVLAQTEARQAKIDAATNNAVTALMAEVSRQPLAGRIAVRDLLQQINGSDALMSTLREADQIGGPRWIDEKVCQVRLEIGGQKVANTLIKLSDSAGDRALVKPAELKSALSTWDRRTFSAIGSSESVVQPDLSLVAPTTRVTRIELPQTPPKWSTEFMRAEGKNGPALSKLRAARAAEQKALATLRQQVNELPVTKDATVGATASQDAALRDAIDRAVQRAKLTKLDYLADGGASVQVTADLADVWREMVASRQDSSLATPR